MAAHWCGPWQLCVSGAREEKDSTLAPRHCSVLVVKGPFDGVATWGQCRRQGAVQMTSNKLHVRAAIRARRGERVATG
jgi:hypothetical protein